MYKPTLVYRYASRKVQKLVRGLYKMWGDVKSRNIWKYAWHYWNSLERGTFCEKRSLEVKRKMDLLQHFRHKWTWVGPVYPATFTAKQDISMVKVFPCVFAWVLIITKCSALNCWNRMKTKSLYSDLFPQMITETKQKRSLVNKERYSVLKWFKRFRYKIISNLISLLP